MIETLLQKIYRKENLSISETRLIGSYMLSGTASSIEITAFLTALKMKGETIDEMFRSICSRRISNSHG